MTMIEKINAGINEICNVVNGAINKQEFKFFVKKNGHWDKATKMDLMFFKSEHMPKRRGDLLQTNTWDNKLLAIFIGNANEKDTHYVRRQLGEAEKMAPEWLRKASMEPGTV